MTPIECQACPKNSPSTFNFTNKGLANMVGHLVKKHGFSFLLATQSVVDFVVNKGREPVE